MARPQASRRSSQRKGPSQKPGEIAKPASAKKPNILVIWGDDIGIFNLSCYSHGTMGYRTPNIDRRAKA